MRCPRCKAEVAEGSAACPRCAAPLSLREEPAPAQLDADLSLDRRRLRRPAPDADPPTDPEPWRPARRPEPPPAEEADVTEPSPWQARASQAPVPAGSGPIPPASPDPAARMTPRIWWTEPSPTPAAAAPSRPARTGADRPAPPRAVAPPPAARDPLAEELLELARPPDAPAPAPRGAAEELGFEILGPGVESVSEPRDAVPAPARRPRQVPLPLPPAGPYRPAPAGKRALSWVVDGTLAGALSWLLLGAGALLADSGAGPPPLSLLPAAAALAAAIHFVHATLGVGLAGQTLGKWMTGIAVVGPEGRTPGPGRAAARAFLSILSAALAGAGLVAVLAGRRAAHDIALATEVVRVP